MRKKILTMLLSIAMIVGLLPLTASAETSYNIRVDGIQVTDSNKDNLSSNTASYDPDSNTLTLKGYNGGCINAEQPLNIDLKNGTANRITVPADTQAHGIYTKGSCSISGGGDLSIISHYKDRFGIYASNNGNLTISAEGDIDITSDYGGIYAAGDTAIRNSNNFSVDSGTTGIAGANNVILAVSGNIDIKAGIYCIYKGSGSGNVTVSGSAPLTAVSTTNHAVYLESSGSSLLLNGTGAPISITAGSGKKAVYNETDGTSPAGGTQLSSYDKVTGAPDQRSVVYDYLKKYNIWVGGTQVNENNINDILNNNTASYDPDSNTLTLKGYNGSYIKASQALNINLKSGTTSRITVPANAAAYGIDTNGSCSISGGGDLSIVSHCEDYSAIHASNNGDITISTEGDIDITSESSGIYAAGDTAIRSSGNISVDSGGTGIAGGNNVIFDGSGDIDIISGAYCIYKGSGSGSATVSGSAPLTAVSTANHAVYLDSSGSSLLLNGTGAPISLTAGSGKKAVYNSADGTSPVSGTNLSSYKMTAGAPDQRSVVYELQKTYNVWVGGTQANENNINDILNDGGTAKYDPETATLTLNNYNGGYIKADQSMTIDLKSGTTNSIRIPSNNEESCIFIEGSCVITGGGDLKLDLQNNNSDQYALKAKNITISGSGNYEFSSIRSAVYADSGGIIYNGSGSFKVDARYTCLSTMNTVDLSGSGNVVLNSGQFCIYSRQGDIIFSGSAPVTAVSISDIAIRLGGLNKQLFLNGTGSPISITAGYDNKAVYNYMNETSPVTGTNLSSYKMTAGAPDQSSVVYEFKKTYDIWVGGTQADENNINDILNDGGTAKYDPETATLTLNNYNGGYIKADQSMTIDLKSGTANYITVPANITAHGIEVKGNCEIKGDGDLEINNKNTDYSYGISADNVTIYDGGEIDITSEKTGIRAEPGSILINGSKNISIDSGTTGISATKNIIFAGSGDIDINAVVYCIYKGSDSGNVIITGSGTLSAVSTSNHAVMMNASGSCLLLNGTSAPISLTSGKNSKAVYNTADGTSPVSGTDLSYYNNVTGAPDQSSVVYEHSTVYVTDVSLNKNSISLVEGGTETLTATVMPETAPNRNVTWSSSDDSVAAVSDTGTVTAVKEGSAVITVTAEDGGMTAECTVTVTGKPAEPLPFTDVKESDWFYNDVEYVFNNKLMNGTSDTTFAPNDKTTRAMIVTILYRLEGSPAVSGGNSFEDVPDGMWYTDPITWASQNGIVKGYSKTEFGTNDDITREQMATILYRYAQKKGYDVSKTKSISSFSDASSVSSYAVEAMEWAYGSGLINGTSATELSPQSGATRAQIAAILHRFCDNIR